MSSSNGHGLIRGITFVTDVAGCEGAVCVELDLGHEIKRYPIFSRVAGRKIVDALYDAGRLLGALYDTAMADIEKLSLEEEEDQLDQLVLKSRYEQYRERTRDPQLALA